MQRYVEIKGGLCHFVSLFHEKEIEAAKKKHTFEITSVPVLAGTCTVWGSPHYYTFDNHHYTFQQNCTYVLVKEIVARHNFTVHINNVLCDSFSTEVCSRSLFVYYKNYKIALSAKKHPKLKTKVVQLIYVSTFNKKEQALTLTQPCIFQRCGSMARWSPPPTQTMTSR